MLVSQLQCYQFRNFQTLNLNFSGRVVGVVGGNGHGKTNILEAIYFACTGGSWRTSALVDLLQIGAIEMKVSLGLLGLLDGELNKLSVAGQRSNAGLQTVRCRYFVNDVPRSKQVLGMQCPVVVFAPEDLLVVTGSPALRRQMLDRVLQVSDLRYGTELRSYNQVLIRRNKLLQAIRDGEQKIDGLQYWTDKMIEHGSRLMVARLKFFAKLDCNEVYNVIYQPNIITSKDSVAKDYAQRVNENFQTEIYTGLSQYGPHKDDLIFRIEGEDAARHGSRGQQRSVMVWFIMQQFKYLMQCTGKTPLVLLDDIFSELDEWHRSQMVDFFAEAQVFISGCEERYFEQGFDQLLRVHSGRVDLI